jgi:alpha,alpha-trehalase
MKCSDCFTRSPHEHTSRAVDNGRPHSARRVALLATGILGLTLGIACAASAGIRDSAGIPVATAQVLSALLAEEDTDHDSRLTVLDGPVRGTSRGDRKFTIRAVDGRSFDLFGIQPLSHLLQELALAQERGSDTTFLVFHKLYEPPADRISRLIRERYWDGLTRTVDSAGLLIIAQDSKLAADGGSHHLYVPASDSLATAYFTSLSRRMLQPRLLVHPLVPADIAEFAAQRRPRHGLLTLAMQRQPDGRLTGVPFVVPGGRFNEMYGWDSYFIALGLCADGRIDLARGMAENLAYEIRHYGKVLNANRTYYLSRSQPPFLTSITAEVHRRMTPGAAAKAWLAGMLAAAITEYDSVWMGTLRRTETGLSRYHDEGSGIPPEVEPGHFAPVFRQYASRHGMTPQALERAYRDNILRIPQLDTFFVHDRAMRESGHDTGYRLLGRCANLVTVDLNALLYKTEDDLARLIRTEFAGSLELPSGRTTTALEWQDRARTRRARIDSLLWDGQRGIYQDYDFVAQRRVPYTSATSLYPLWAGCASTEQARRSVSTLLPLLEEPGGIASSDELSRGPVTPEHPLRQWDHPFGWAPHQMLAWSGLQRYGFDALVQRLVYRWLFTITINAAHFAGTVTEKYDVQQRSHQVFAEYGNVGTDFSYITREGFGWTNASYQVGLQLLTPSLRGHLNLLHPPEWLFPPVSKAAAP